MNKISKSIDYKELLKQMDIDYVTFAIEQDSGFIESLINDEFTCIVKAVKPSVVTNWHKQKEHAYDSCMPTSHAETGAIWVEEKQAYYTISLVKREDDKFDVSIMRMQVGGPLTFIEDQK